MKKLVPKKKHALIKLCVNVLNLKSNILVTEEHVSKVRAIFQEHLKSGMSPSDIKKEYGIEYSDFGMFLKKCLNMKLLSTKDAINNWYKKTGRSLTDEKAQYKKRCAFQFDPYSMPQIPGYDLLLSRGIFHPTKNQNGVCRDHMVSVEYGWRNKVDPTIISHFMNCRFISNSENSQKGDKSCITLDMLQERINKNIFTVIENVSIRLPKSLSTREKIRQTNKKYMNITNGVKNMRVLKNSHIPNGWRQGLTKKKKLS
jgi:hypothetical protein